MAVHLSRSAHERRKWLTSRGHKMAVLPWSQSRNIKKSRHIQCRGRPFVSLLQSVQTGKVVQNVVFVSQVVQPLTAPITFFTIQGLSCKRATDQTVSWVGRAPCCVTRRPEEFVTRRRWLPEQHCSTSRGSTLSLSSIVIEATCDNTGKQPGSALFTETRIPVDTHLMSNCPFVRPALSHIAGVRTSACWRSGWTRLRSCGVTPS